MRYKTHYRRPEEDSRETEAEDLLYKLYDHKLFGEDEGNYFVTEVWEKY